jgi:hypothetical protein
VPLAEFEKFFNAALGNDENLYRLMSDGSTRRPTLKVFYDGQTNGVFNSVLANDFVERAGANAVSLDRTKLGQFLFRSNLQNVIDGGFNSGTYNRQLSAVYASTLPVERNVLFLPSRADLTTPSIVREIELPEALKVSSDTATFDGVTKRQILEASAGAVSKEAKDLANLVQSPTPIMTRTGGLSLAFIPLMSLIRSRTGRFLAAW